MSTYTSHLYVHIAPGDRTRYWRALTLGLRIAEFRDAATFLAGDQRWGGPTDYRLGIAAVYREAADIIERAGVPATPNAWRRLRSALHGIRVRHPALRSMTPNLANHGLPEPTLTGLRAAVRSLESATKLLSPTFNGPDLETYWRTRGAAYKALGAALTIDEPDHRRAAVETVGRLHPAVGHLSTGIVWDLDHLRPEKSTAVPGPA